MTRILNRAAVVALALAVVVVVAEVAEAQRGGGRGRGRGFGRGGFGLLNQQPLSKLALLNNEQVQTELALSEEKVAEIETMVDAYRDARRELFTDGFDGNFQEIQSQQEELENQFSTQAVASLEEGKAKRLQEIYVQVNGASALFDAEIARALGLSEEQQTRLATVGDENAETLRGSMQELRDLEGEERDARVTEMQTTSNANLLAVLSDEQKTQFEGLKGTALELDRSEVQNLGGRGFGGRGRGGRGRRGGADDDAAESAEGDADGF